MGEHPNFITLESKWLVSVELSLLGKVFHSSDIQPKGLFISYRPPGLLDSNFLFLVIFVRRVRSIKTDYEPCVNRGWCSSRLYR